MNHEFEIIEILLVICSLPLCLIVSRFFVKKIIGLVRYYNILDQPDHRKHHQGPTPSMGGIGIIMTMLCFLIIPAFYMGKVELFFVALSLISFSVLGFVDDWKNLNAKLKLFIQLAFSLVGYFLGFKVDYAFGVFGFYDLPEGVSFLLTIGIYILLINAYNLMDGIDELVGGLLTINFCGFIIVFLLFDQFEYVFISVFGLGAIIGFLKYNTHPAKIFMGDSGSLPLGMLMAILTFKVLEVVQGVNVVTADFQWVILGVVAVNMVPVFDTLRVFSIRILKGYSPFMGDRSHLHHLLLKNMLGHKKSALFIHLSHVGVILTAVFFSFWLPLLISLILTLLMTIIVFEYNTLLRIKIKTDNKYFIIQKEKNYLKKNNLLKFLKD